MAAAVRGALRRAGAAQLGMGGGAGRWTSVRGRDRRARNRQEPARRAIRGRGACRRRGGDRRRRAGGAAVGLSADRRCAAARRGRRARRGDRGRRRRGRSGPAARTAGESARACIRRPGAPAGAGRRALGRPRHTRVPALRRRPRAGRADADRRDGAGGRVRGRQPPGAHPQRDHARRGRDADRDRRARSQRDRGAGGGARRPRRRSRMPTSRRCCAARAETHSSWRR